MDLFPHPPAARERRSPASDDFVGQTTDTATQIAGSGQALAERREPKQAASLEETSASLEEMAGMTKRNAESAQNAKALAGQARIVVDTGAANMKQMSAAMRCDQNLERRNRKNHQDDRRDRVSDQHPRP